ncbi:diguanylate cyclase (GGDEF)-like protein [Rhodanobacter sp. ANJX3]|uniref:GGDEF domain-containing protein n=1 Tax=unclassified Rhodanobacter TaxID=2621553 RepID=UPI0015C924E0|nr:MULTISPECIES: GGDEF domain-containing protein [unclassified Rhodanobacter]MBB5357115.1 diguanylate cyclase (GGDEF)-like protein [Rhodanobacter sp. ANJX3]NYE27169.1 diguanylate cyclase (GGDEF)-like protein [Rhodanobacter sp. K2T2]
MESIARLAHAGTLLIVNAMLAAFSSAFFFSLYFTYPRVKKLLSVRLWGFSYAAFAVGFGILILPAFHVSFPTLGIVGNLSIDTGVAIGLVAVVTYLNLGKRYLWVLFPALVLAAIETGIVLREGENFRWMVIIGGVLTGMVTVVTGIAFWRCTDEAKRSVARLIAAFHFLWALMLLVRATWWAFHPLASPNQDPTSTFGLLSRMLLTWVIAPGVLWILTRRLDAEMIRYASHDPLTGVFNRRVIWEQGERRVAQLGEGEGDLAVIMIDVDNFKSINDRWGHDGGDHVLVAIADTLRKHVRHNDILARVGGEEFMVLIHHAAAVQDIAERMRRAVEQESIVMPSGDRSSCTVSIGIFVASTSSANKSWKGIVVAADEALYAAKRGGRNRVVLSSNTTSFMSVTVND